VLLEHCPNCGFRQSEGSTLCPRADAPPCLAQDGSSLIGRALDGRYTLLSVLASGGMGAVFRALQHATDREVAVKLLPASAVVREDAVLRFVTEGKALSRLSDPHTVAIIDFGRTRDGMLFLVMEMLHGRTVRDLVVESGRLPPIRALRLAFQVLDALESAHGLGIVHCDVKPENLMVLGAYRHRDFVKVLDFGVARLVRDEGRGVDDDGLLVGTPEHMAPEQVTNVRVDQRTDLYALGSVLFFMLTGRFAFEEADAVTLLRRKLAEPPPLLNAYLPPPGVPNAVEDLVARLLATHPEDRPDNVWQARALLDSALVAASATGVTADIAITGTSPKSTESPIVEITEPRLMRRTLVSALSMKTRATALFSAPIAPSSPVALATLRDGLLADEASLAAWLEALIVRLRCGSRTWSPVEFRSLKRQGVGAAVLALSDAQRRAVGLDESGRGLFDSAIALGRDSVTFWETESARAPEPDRRHFTRLMGVEERGYLAELVATRELLDRAAGIKRAYTEGPRRVRFAPAVEPSPRRRKSVSSGLASASFVLPELTASAGTEPDAVALPEEGTLARRIWTGHATIDAQHREFLRLTWALAQAPPLDRLGARGLLERIAHLEQAHFLAEEKAMHDVGFLGLAGHFREHDDLRNRTQRVLHAVDSGAPIEQVQVMIRELIERYLSGHLETADAEMAEALRAAGGVQAQPARC